MTSPEKTFKMGAVRASVFLNTFQRNGQTLPIRKVVLEVRYKDKEGQWQSTNSLSLNDLPKAITALQQAYEYLLSAGTPYSDNRTIADPDQDAQPSRTSPYMHPEPLPSERSRMMNAKSGQLGSYMP